MKNLARDILLAVIAAAVVGTLGITGWRLAVLAVLLVAVYFRPRGDPGEARETHRTAVRCASERD